MHGLRTVRPQSRFARPDRVPEIAKKTKRHHCGLGQRVSRSTLADANEGRDPHLFEPLEQPLIEIALDLYKDHDIDLGLKEPLYATDSTTIDPRLKLFPLG